MPPSGRPGSSSAHCTRSRRGTEGCSPPAAAGGRETEPLPFDPDDEDADLRVRPDESTSDILAFYARARTAADRVIDEVGLDETGRAWTGEPVSMRCTLIHLIEETARHAGHMDILRELIDGATGDHRTDAA
ncbi:DUF664 domain-containing protein [Cellulomonas sp. WB94]|uniref:mycothiol transferase n=1 Tax=Cellulomonas sp. WB94 TaxID=2173174 RepID=UPI001F5B086D|nr:DUF664 domain-containing protein [Cellulomonas sp. WB94]